MKVRVTLMTSNDVPVSTFKNIHDAEILAKSAWDMFVSVLKMQNNTNNDDVYVEKVEIVKDEG